MRRKRFWGYVKKCGEVVCLPARTFQDHKVANDIPGVTHIYPPFIAARDDRALEELKEKHETFLQLLKMEIAGL